MKIEIHFGEKCQHSEFSKPYNFYFILFFLKLSRMILSFNFVAKLASNSNKALWVCHRTLNATSILRDLEPIPKFQIKRFVCLCCKFKLTPKNPYDISKLTISIIIISFFGKGM